MPGFIDSLVSHWHEYGHAHETLGVGLYRGKKIQQIKGGIQGAKKALREGNFAQITRRARSQYKKEGIKQDAWLYTLGTLHMIWDALAGSVEKLTSLLAEGKVHDRLTEKATKHFDNIQGIWNAMQQTRSD